MFVVKTYLSAIYRFTCQETISSLSQYCKMFFDIMTNCSQLKIQKWYRVTRARTLYFWDPGEIWPSAHLRSVYGPHLVGRPGPWLLIISTPLVCGPGETTYSSMS